MRDAKQLTNYLIRRFDEIDICVREQYWLLTLQGKRVFHPALCPSTILSHLLALEALCQELGMSDLHQLDAEKKKQLRNAAKVGFCVV